MLQHKNICFAALLLASVFATCLTSEEALNRGQIEKILQRQEVSSETLADLKEKISKLFVQLSNQENGPTLNLKRIANATEQDVEGKLYELDVEVSTSEGDKECHLELFEGPWNGGHQTLGITCNEKYYEVVHESLRKKRGIPDYSDIDPKDYSELGKRVTEYLNLLIQQKKSPKYSLVKINNGTQQVVDGWKHEYLLNADLSEENSENITSCDLQLWEQPWREYSDVTITCQGKDYKVTKGPYGL